MNTSPSTRKRSTLLIVDAQKTQSLTVNTFLLYAIKPLLLFLSFLTVILAIALSYFVLHYLDGVNKNQSLQSEVNHLKNATSSEVEAKISALEESETAIIKLQTYLKERGVDVNPVSFKRQETGINNAAGGPEIELAKPIPYIGSFSEQTNTLLTIAQSIPLGRPHHGEQTSGFGYRANPFTGRGAEFHGGLDFRGTYGEPVYTTATGKVSYANRMGGYGLLVIVQHNGGYETRYAHLNEIDVKVGDKVTVGQQIGKLGSSGRSTGPHLHYEVRQHGERLDPANFLNLS